MRAPKILIIILLFSLFFSYLPAGQAGLPALAQEYDATIEALFDFGEVLFKQQRYNEAKEEFQKCILLNPRHQEAKKRIELCEERIAAAKNKAMVRALERTEKEINSQPKIAAKVIPEENESVSPPIGKGAWTLKKGQMYAELYTKYYWHNSQFDGKGHKKRWGYEGKGNEIRTELKLEYGFNDALTLMLATVAKEAHWKDSYKSCTTKGFVEMWPGLKYNLFSEPFICTLQGRVKFPFHYNEQDVPALGKHQIDEELKILTAQPWPKLPGYTKFETGYRIRNEEPADEIPYFFEFGYNPHNWLVLKTTLDCSKGLASTGDSEDWMKYTLGPIFRIKDIINIELGFGHTFYGKNTSAAKEIICSLSSQW